MMKYDAVIVGAGPGGLRCGKLLSEHGATVLILEKNKTIGKKVCAGGITWNGLLERIPASLIEQSFSQQTISTPLQHVEISKKHPIIATVNRQSLGSHLSESARNYGADIRTDARLISISEGRVSYLHNDRSHHVLYDYLIGADGSFSKVRSHIGLITQKYGLGINYNIPLSSNEMVWHFNAKHFGSGYSWIFPHRNSSSVGVYIGHSTTKPLILMNHLRQWLKNYSIQLEHYRPQAEKICFDYQGWNFGQIFLLGDAAGLASPLTGEGIYPAFVSAEAVARTIINQIDSDILMQSLISKHRKHALMLKVANRNRMLASCLTEVSAFLLRSGLISFEKFEMV